jgi:DNA-binding MarR family transcriptional regulator
MSNYSAAPLSGEELAAWRGLLRTHAAVTGALDAELLETHGLPLTSYEVLLFLAAAAEGRMRMSELADSVLLSRSGLTRLVDRLEREGYVERTTCPDDARGAYARLTDAGRAKLEAASGTHLEGIREHFLQHFERSELAVLAEAWERVGSAGSAGSAAGPTCTA